MTSLPRSLDGLRGLRAARWIRESSAGQYDRYGPDSQRAEQDRAIGQFDLKDNGLVYQVAASGRTVWQSDAMKQMVADAQAGRFDVLLAGYSDRWQRNVRQTLTVLEDDLHPFGVAVYFADRQILSSNPKQWEDLVREALGAEVYSRRLAERIRDGFAAKFAREYGDQGGTTPLGFRRTTQPPHVLEIDPDRIGQAVALFETYATGQHSFTTLGTEVGMAPERVREILAAPIFNGWYRRGKRSREEQRKAAPWRANPPVSDDLWDRVQEVRRQKAHGGGPHRTDRVDLLAGLLYCSCGRYVKGNGTSGSGKVRAHVDPCNQWGQRLTYPVETWLTPLAAQVQQIDLSDRTVAQVMAALSEPAPRGDDLARKRLQRRRARLAEDMAAGRLDGPTFLGELTRLDAEVQSLARSTSTPATVTADQAVAYLRNLPALWADAGEQERADLLHAIYARVEVQAERFAAVHLTPAAEAHGLALALPEEVAMARPAGIEPAT